MPDTSPSLGGAPDAIAIAARPCPWCNHPIAPDDETLDLGHGRPLHAECVMEYAVDSKDAPLVYAAAMRIIRRLRAPKD